MNSSKLRRTLPLLFGVAFVLGCSSGSNPGVGIGSLNLPSAVSDAYSSGRSVSPSLAKADNDLGYSLLQKLQAAEPAKNMLISPVSLELPLDILYSGARGETQTTMAKTLGITGVSADALNTDNAALQAGLVSTDPKLQIQIANSLWQRPKDFPLLDSFVQTNKVYYGSEIGDLAGAPKAIDDWVTAKTHGAITKAAPDLDYSAVVSVLVNTVYFKGAWTSPFDPKNTRDAPFTLLAGDIKQVPTMSQELSFPYFKDAGVEIARLPYGDKRWEMVVALPAQGTSWNSFLKSLTHAQIETWVSQTSAHQFILSLPKFKFASRVNLKPSLSALGLSLIFTPDAPDFSGISTTPTYISYLSQSGYIEVNEEGTTAAAVTTGGVGTTSAPPSFQVNRPFAFLIRDTKTGVILFAGTMLDPTATQ